MREYTQEELLKICPVCGYDGLEVAPFDTYGHPTHSICSCCGFEFGFDDESKGFTYESYREAWISKGFKLFNHRSKSGVWSEEIMLKQLKNIEKVRHYRPR